MEDKNANKISLIDRKSLVLTGVQHVEKFNEEEIVLETNMGILFLRGEDLHIIQLDLEKGTLSAEGFFSAMQFRESKAVFGPRGKGKNLLGRLLK